MRKLEWTHRSVSDSSRGLVLLQEMVVSCSGQYWPTRLPMRKTIDLGSIEFRAALHGRGPQRRHVVWESVVGYSIKQLSNFAVLAFEVHLSAVDGLCWLKPTQISD